MGDEYEKNYMTDASDTRWVKLAYANLRMAQSDQRITDLERRNGELEKLLAVAACPMCDGSGAFYGHDRAVCCNRPTESGECCNNPIPEQTMEPCQFCEERHALTRTKEQSNAES